MALAVDRRDGAAERLADEDLAVPPDIDLQLQLSQTEKTTEDIVALLRKRPEIKNIFVDGGRVPPGTTEVRRASLIINYTPKNERKISQRELELEIGKDLENVPDIRYWFLDENGLRAPWRRSLNLLNMMGLQNEGSGAPAGGRARSEFGPQRHEGRSGLGGGDDGARQVLVGLEAIVVRQVDDRERYRSQPEVVGGLGVQQD